MAHCEDIGQYLCQPIESATVAAARQSDATAAATPGTKALGNVEMFPSAIEISDVHPGFIQVSTEGNGSYRLPAGPTDGSKVWSTATFTPGAPITGGGGGGGGSGGGITGFTWQLPNATTDAWKLAFAEVALKYQRPGAGDGADAAVLVNGTASPCPVAALSGCLPNTGFQGTGRTVHFQIAPDSLAQSVNLTVAPADRATLETATLVSQSLESGPDLTIGGGGMVTVPAGAMLGRVRVRTSMPVGGAMLDGRIQPALRRGSTSTNGSYTTLLSGANFTTGTHVLTLLDTAGLPMPPYAVLGTDTALAMPGNRTGAQVVPGGQLAVHGLYVPNAIRRSSVWFRVSLEDAALPTTFAVNESPPQLLQPLVQSGPTQVDVLVQSAYLLADTNTAYTRVFCATPQCAPTGNVTDITVAVDINERAADCMAVPEICDTLDNDCNGLTDEAADQLCDGPDPDGCALGRPGCGTSAVCTESLAAPRLTPAPATLQVTPASVTAIFEDGGEAAMTTVPQPFDLFTVLQNGAYIPEVVGLQSPQGNHRLTGLRVHLASAPSIPWNNVSTPVSVRSIPADDGLTFTLTVPGGADISAGHKLILVHDNAPDVLPVNTVFGCPGGELTLPSTLRVRNACDFPNVDCNAASGPGSACDSNPASPMCPTCSGDYDGCRQGFWLPLGPDGALVCSADQAVQAASPIADILQVTIATATFYYDTGAPVVVAADNQPFDLFLALATGTLPIAGLVAPMPPAYGAHLRAIRLTLAAGTVAQIPDGQSGWTQVTPRSGSDDTGVDIDLGFGPNGPMLPPGTPIRAMAQSSSSPDGWRASYQCPGGGRTVPRRIDVTAQ